MQPIDSEKVQHALNARKNQPIYLHLETTNGAYASHWNNKNMNVGVFIRNAKVTYTEGKIKGEGPYRVGLKTDLGWVYAEGLTDFVEDTEGRLLLAGHDPDGKLAVALQLSVTQFE
ncbi:YojF family protein [Bacillus sp. HMF5848]|uniref:YojF family protein n=1 Tax=Bacillus sp. HMF5848 TaxID=2495421 RepID=UPI00163AF064|nr:YojF family protein [Bacillus sp. HMF5848]